MLRVRRQDSPWAAQHRQPPPSTQAPPRRRPSPAISVSTKEGTEDSESVMLSTRTWMSSESTAVIVVMPSILPQGAAAGAIGIDDRSLACSHPLARILHAEARASGR